MPTLWHIKGKNFKTFLLGNWQSVFCIKILPYIRALICYINRNQKKICILSAMKKKIPKSSVALSNILYMLPHDNWDTHSFVNLSSGSSYHSGWSKPYSKRFIWKRSRVLALLQLQIGTIFCFVWNYVCEHTELPLACKMSLCKLEKTLLLDRPIRKAAWQRNCVYHANSTAACDGFVVIFK